MAQKVFSSQTPVGCLAQPMGGLHPALEITDPKDGLKLKTEKHGKKKKKKFTRWPQCAPLRRLKALKVWSQGVE